MPPPPYDPQDDLTKERKVDVVVGDEINANTRDGAGNPITSTLVGPKRLLDVSIAGSSPPASSNDFYSDETINAIPVPPATLTLNMGFTAIEAIIVNLSGNPIYASFDGGVVFHRISVGFSKTFDAKAFTSIVLLGTAGGEAYEVDAW